MSKPLTPQNRRQLGTVMGICLISGIANVHFASTGALPWWMLIPSAVGFSMALLALLLKSHG